MMERSRRERNRLNFPLRCSPLLRRKIWGGRGLAEVLGKALPPGELVGEAWEVADLPEASSSIADGPLANVSLREVMERFGPELLPRGGDQFPLLVKFIDVQDDSSIQVHPDAETCRRLYPDERCKSETWVIIHAEPGSAVVHGFREGVTAEEVRRRIADRSIAEVLRRVPVAPGDVLHLPAGTIHAMLRGVMLLEVQQPSDSTFRIEDYDRPGPEGRPRELHVEQALQSLHVGESGAPRVIPRLERFEWGTREVLVSAGAYRMQRLTLHAAMCWRQPSDVPAVMVVVIGSVEVRWPEGEALFSMGESLIVPPGVEELTIVPVGESQVVVALPASR
ncbi:MAG: type I phosphomannose isomerase catalytic subunit [Armatimonadota bacterium]|nr:type I phosphomannose isomerase catalytic subunit [Armatimonadota bacterium]